MSVNQSYNKNKKYSKEFYSASLGEKDGPKRGVLGLPMAAFEKLRMKPLKRG